jgi:bifunctional DNA-binding transcriptional regulator/antitoxin component of YhaV-PrlF toxin-antitoxin module
LAVQWDFNSTAVNEVVSVDEKGRLVLIKKLREAAGIGAGTEILAKVSRLGRVKLTDLKVPRARAREIGQPAFALA